MSKHITSALAGCLLAASFPVSADQTVENTYRIPVPDQFRSDWHFSPGLEMIGGGFANNHLREGTSGREHQLKMTRALITLSANNGPWRAVVEGVLLGDEIQVVDGDPSYRDIYRNQGSDLYYYGDYPVREAFIGQYGDDWYWRAGRMLSLSSERPEDRYFEVGHESPHAVILNTGLFNGVQAGMTVADGHLRFEGGILGGRDRPCLDAQCYLGGALDVNEKGNNTLAFEGKMTYLFDWIELYGHAFVNKTGSAVGTFTSGKHNDSRFSIGANLDLLDDQYYRIKLRAQASRFVLGLTEEGVQGESTPTESYNIPKVGYFVSSEVTFKPLDASLRITHERMDRADATVFQSIASYDESHPAMEATESRTIVSLSHDFGNGLHLRGYYRADDVPYLTGGDQKLEDRAGILLSFKTEL